LAEGELMRTAVQFRRGAPVTDKACLQNYYKGGQAFLVFLAQQYGTEIFTRLIEARGTGIDALDEAVRAVGGSGFKDAFRRWGAAPALPDAAATPAGYGYPARTFGVAGECGRRVTGTSASTTLISSGTTPQRYRQHFAG
jgi:Peptidase M30